jgi:hypothetical protein
MQFFKSLSRIKKIIVILIFADLIFFVFSFFSPSLPRLGMFGFHLEKELLVFFFVFVFFFCLLNKEKIITLIRDRGFQQKAGIFIGIVSLQFLTRIPFLINHNALLNSDRSVLFLMIKNISSGVSFPVYFYGQFYQGSLNAYFYSLIHALIPSLRLSVIVGNIIIFSLVIFFSSLLINKITDSRSFFYPVLILSLPLTGLIFFSNDETRGIPFVVLFEILLITLVYRVIFERKEHFVWIGLISGILFWIYQPSSTIMMITLGWMSLFLLIQRRFLVFARAFLFTICGFVVGSLPHLLAEINNGFINTKVLFFSKNILSNVRALNKIAISNLTGAVVTDLDANEIVSGMFVLFFAAGFIFSVYVAARNRDTRKIYLPALFCLNLMLLLLSRYPPLPRYLVHYRLYSFLAILIAVLLFMEIRLFDRRLIKILFVLCFVLITVWKSVERYPRLRASHGKNTKDIAEIRRTKEKVILGNYWHTMRLAPFLCEEKLMTAPPSSFRPDGIFALSKYYPAALRLGELWERENIAFIALDRKKDLIDTLLSDFDVSFTRKILPSGEYVLFSDFSKDLSGSFYDLLNSNLKTRYEQGIKPSYSFMKEWITEIPLPVIEEGHIVFVRPDTAGLPIQDLPDDFFKDWRCVLQKGDRSIGFPLDFSKKKISYSFPESLACESGKYQIFFHFMGMPVHHHGELELQERDQDKSLIVSFLTDSLSFVPFQDGQKETRKGLPIDGLEIRLLDEEITSLELHVYSFFNFSSSIWTALYSQQLVLNERIIPISHGLNEVKISMKGEHNLKLRTRHRTLLHTKDSRGNVMFYNTGAILEKIVIHTDHRSSTVVPFLREEQ